MGSHGPGLRTDVSQMSPEITLALIVAAFAFMLNGQDRFQFQN